MGKEYGKGKRGIGFKIGVASVVAAAGIGAVIALVALAGFPFSSDTGTGSEGSSGGLAGTAGSVVVPSDEEGGVVQGDGFIVTTEVLGAESKNYPGTAIAVISNVRIVKVRDAGNRGDFRVDFDVKWRTADTKVAYSDNIKNLYTKEAYYSHGSGNTFCVYQGKEIYLRIISSNQHEGALSGIYKVAYSGQS